MALAKHIEVARTEGPKAGFNSWIEMMERSGLPQVQERLAEVQAQGNKKAQFEYYCNVYGDKIFGRQNRGSNVVHEDTDEAGIDVSGAGQDVQALFQQFLAVIGGTQGASATTEDEDDLDDDDVEAIIASHTGTQTTQGTQTRSSGRRSSGRGTTQQTRNQGNAQGGADQFAPRNPQDDATSGRLWRLNELGLLRLADKPGKHISNGQAHEILKARLG